MFMHVECTSLHGRRLQECSISTCQLACCWGLVHTCIVHGHVTVSQNFCNIPQLLNRPCYWHWCTRTTMTTRGGGGDTNTVQQKTGRIHTLEKKTDNSLREKKTICHIHIQKITCRNVCLGINWGARGSSPLKKKIVSRNPAFF